MPCVLDKTHETNKLLAKCRGESHLECAHVGRLLVGNLDERAAQVAQGELYELHQLECLEPIATEVGKRWHFCGRGSRLIAATSIAVPPPFSWEATHGI